jgi:hypothetical protein
MIKKLLNYFLERHFDLDFLEYDFLERDFDLF